MAHEPKRNTKSLGTLGLAAIIFFTGVMGNLFTSSVTTSGFFGAVRHLHPGQILRLQVLSAVAFVGLVFVAGLALSYFSHQSAKDLWNKICPENALGKRDLWALVLSCGPIGLLFDRAIASSGVVPAMYQLSYSEFSNPSLLPQIAFVTLVAIAVSCSSRFVPD